LQVRKLNNSQGTTSCILTVALLGVHNLICLCLKAKRPAPANFNFCSSVSAVAATKGGFVPEDLPAELSYSQGMGYARSKLVTEHICILAGKETGISARVLRVGQVIGDTVHGIWNDTEAIPMMLQAATTIGAIPALDENPLWLPVDTVAHGVTDISLSDAGPGVMNIVNHQSFHWTRDLLPALRATGLQFEEVGQMEWINRLRNSDLDPITNPPIKLLEFFASKYDNNTTKRPGLTYDTRNARSFSPHLTAAPVLNKELVRKFIQHWKRTSWTINPVKIAPKANRQPRLIILAGPCGSGKSTLAHGLAEKFHIPWIEGDNLHSPTSLTKMTHGEALSSADRWAWLSRIKDAALVQFKMGAFKPDAQDVVIVTCSALKAEYRADLRKIVEQGVQVTFFVLQTGLETLKTRMAERVGHYMKVEMVEGQVEILEGPGVEETDIVPVDVGRGREEVQREIDALFEDVTGKKAKSWQVQV
jgi:carbohydrate kinase (thermoresistant glucokinase family)